MSQIVFATKTIALCLVFCSTGYASEQTGKIDSIQVLNDGRHIIFMESTRTGKPSCATYDYWFIKDENSTSGKTQMGILLAAKLANNEVHVSGTSACTRWVDGEDISSVKLM